MIGRTLAAQEPPEYIKTEQFDAISDYLIPKPQLCGRLLTLRAFGHVVLCWPTCIENNKKYARNALIFSLGLVLQPAAGDEGAPHRYGEVLGRAAACLTELERESSFLSARRDELHHLLPQLLRDLRARGRCTLAVDASHAVELALPPRPPPPPPPPQDHLAPVLVAEPPAAAVRGWDLALQRLLPLMDGTQPVARIAAAACVDVALARRATATLQAGGWVRLLPLFSFSQRYAATAALHDAARAPPPARPSSPPPRGGRPRRRRRLRPCCGCSPRFARPTTAGAPSAPSARRSPPSPRRSTSAPSSPPRCSTGCCAPSTSSPSCRARCDATARAAAPSAAAASRGSSTAARRSPRSRASSTSAPPTSSAASSPRSTAARSCSDSR